MRIGICAPATPLFQTDADRAMALAAAGFPEAELVFHEDCFAVHGHFAGDDDTRLAALVQMANDPTLDAIWFARGGYGSSRIANEAIAQMNSAAQDKIYLGYSDCGFLLSALYRAGFQKVAHGPMVADLKRAGGEAAVRRALSFLVRGDRAALEPNIDAGVPTLALNLTILSTMIGSDWQCDLAGHVLMVEEVAEYDYATDRALGHIISALADKGLAGLRMGRVTDVPENERPFGESAQEMAQRWCNYRGVKFLGDADIGHDIDNKIVPFGLASRWPLS